MPSEEVAVPSTPGNCSTVFAGTSDSRRGNVTGSRPDGLNLPNSTSATAFPSSSPGYQACRIAGTWLTHGMRTGLPVLTTTTVRGFAAATADTSASWLPGSDRLGRSLPSDSLPSTMTIATSALRAAAAADDVSVPLFVVTFTPGPARLRSPVLGLTVYSGLTCELPPPPVLATSGPISAIRFRLDDDNGSTGDPFTRLFFSRTMPISARVRATAPCALAGIGWGFGVRSKIPNSIILVYRRINLSSIVAIDTWPFCTAVKSEKTNPSKPHSCLRMSVSSNGFSQLKVPLMLGYAHITEPTWPSLTAASNAGR